VPGKVVRALTPEEIAMNTWIAEHYVERLESTGGARSHE
jgi:hypothetical protein